MTTPLTVENASSLFGEGKPPHLPEFRRLDSLAKGESETFLIYGGSGTGKTWFAGTAGDRTLFIDNGNGINTFHSPLFQQKVGANPIIISIGEKMEGRGVFDDAIAYDLVCDTIDYALQKFPEEFDTIVIDDVTQLRKSALNKGLEFNQNTGKSQTLKNIKEKYDMVVAAVQDYGAEMSLVEQFIAGYTTTCKQAGKHLIMNAHERLTYRKGEKIGDPAVLAKTSPGFTGQTFPDAVTAYFDHVWYFQVVGAGSQRVWRATTQGREDLAAKTRSGGVFEPLEENPNFLDCIRRIRESSLNKSLSKKK